MDQIDDTEYEDALNEMEKETKPKKSKKLKSSKQPASETKILDIEERERILLAQLLNNSDLFIKGIAFFWYFHEHQVTE